ncbi:OrNVorf136-like [Venturia canescens]|uniref:OrNVorf136-like n=1 Tax=Venturia canescens TaxID=32260 RepID=A0ACB9ZHU6_9HYME|nr:uncharacterized LOC122408208 [Venturia canescens]KAI5630595.1 OrNVorf136-like [Venturia canescens]
MSIVSSPNEWAGTDHQVLLPVYEWLIPGKNDLVKYPRLLYRTVESLDVPTDDELLLGGSWTNLTDTPWYDVRVLLCEDNLFPYDLTTPHFRVARGVFLWGAFNLSVKTHLKDEETMFVYHLPGKCIGKFEFRSSSIRLTEIVRKNDDENSMDTSS